MEVYYLGPEASYSHILASKSFVEEQYQLVGLKSFGDIIDKVLNDNNCIGVLPIENSTTSNVHENIDHIFQNDIQIIGEAYLMISMHLLGVSGSKTGAIDTVHSHPKALEQCSKFIKEHNIKKVVASSTAEAAQLVVDQNSKNIAAIGSSDLAETKNLSILEQNIANQKHNMTRFVFVSTKTSAPESTTANKISVKFSAKHQPGSLAKILAEISACNANLSYIQSKPIPGQDFHYSFWIDIEVQNQTVSKVIEKLKDVTLSYKLRGKYEKGTLYYS